MSPLIHTRMRDFASRESGHNSLESSDPVASVGSSLTILSASPTCLRMLTSRLRSLDLIAAFSANPWGFPLMAANCYCRGSELEDNLLR